MRKNMYERERLYVRGRMCVREREREQDNVCVCVCVRKNVYACARKRESEENVRA